MQVSPHQPFFDIRALTHALTPTLSATVRFSGDVFEMEDQRNWTDATFKTYSTPLAIPFPVEVPSGTELRQSVVLQLEEDANVTIEQLAEHCRLPSIGVQAGIESDAADYVSVNLNLAGGNIAQAWSAAVQQSGGKSMECAVQVSEEAQLDELRSAFDVEPAPVCRWLVFPDTFADPLRRTLATTAAVLTGSQENFAQVNRSRPRMDKVDGICFPINPQTHAIDDYSIVENLGAQIDVLSSARQIAASKLVAINAVSFKAPPSADLNRAWTLLSIGHLSIGGASSVTYSSNAAIAEILPDIAPFAGGEVVGVKSSHPLLADALILRHGVRTRVFLVNLAKEQTCVLFNGQTFDLDPVSIRILDFA